MTEAELLAAERAAASTAVVVEIASVATAVPEHVVTQDDATERARKVYPQYARLEALYTNTGIDDALLGRAGALAPHDPHVGGALGDLPAQRAGSPGAGRAPVDRGGRPDPARHRHHRHQHHHRPLHPEPRGPADEPPRLPPRRGAPADLRARLRGRRRRAGALRPHGAGAARRQRALPHRRPVLALPARQRPEPRDVRRRGAVRRRSGGRRAAQPGRQRGRTAPAAPASARRASTSGPAPSTSWAGTSRTTASASC